MDKVKFLKRDTGILAMLHVSFTGAIKVAGIPFVEASFLDQRDENESGG